jgi:hypothetical protein
MRFALQVAGLLVGLPLEVLIIAALLRGPYRKYPFVFAYTIVNFLITLLEVPPSIDYVRGIHVTNTPLASLYWVDEIVEQGLIYAVVMSLIYGATRTLQSRRVVRLTVLAAAVLIAGISFLVHYNPALNRGSWMTPWSRDLNFCSAVLDLGLWALLIGSRTRDHQMLLLSGGLGVKFAGESIGESVRQLAIRSRSRPISLTGNVIIMLADICFFYIWWQALRMGGRPELAAEKKKPPSRTGIET